LAELPKFQPGDYPAAEDLGDDVHTDGRVRPAGRMTGGSHFIGKVSSETSTAGQYNIEVEAAEPGFVLVEGGRSIVAKELDATTGIVAGKYVIVFNFGDEFHFGRGTCS
jgi:hypothetical protein